MPCYSESPSDRENYTVLTLINYVLKKKGVFFVDEIKYTNFSTQEDCDKNTEILCSLINAMTEREVDEIVYNARDPKSRQLADWWESHQKFDQARREEETRKTREKIIQSIVEKLRTMSVGVVKNIARGCGVDID